MLHLFTSLTQALSVDVGFSHQFQNKNEKINQKPQFYSPNYMNPYLRIRPLIPQKFVLVSTNLDWNSFFSDEIQPNVPIIDQNFTREQRKEVLNGNAYLLNCFFSNISQSESGTALFYSVNNGSILVEHCSFSSCHVLEDGEGTIYIKEGNFVMHQVCGCECTCESNCAMISCWSSPLSTVLDCSVSSCIAKSDNTMYHRYGHINVTRLNLSNNQCVYTSGIHCNPNCPFQDSNVGNIITFCSFAKNNATKHHCVERI